MAGGEIKIIKRKAGPLGEAFLMFNASRDKYVTIAIDVDGIGHTCGYDLSLEQAEMEFERLSELISRPPGSEDV